MQKFQFVVTIPASGGSNRIRLSDAAISAGKIPPGAAAVGNAVSSYLPACKLFLQMQPGGTGMGYLGDSTVDDTGAGGPIILSLATSTAPGASAAIEDQSNMNSVNLGDWYIHGAHAGDKVSVIYHQN